MKTVQVIRNWQDKNQTLGNCSVLGDEGKPIFTAISLERGWRDNQRNVSCVPLGEYLLVLEYSPRFKQNLWELKEVPNRSECKFHAANYWRQLNGCIALGLKLVDIDGDGYNDVTNSRYAMDAFHEAMGDDTTAMLVIKDCIVSC